MNLINQQKSLPNHFFYFKRESGINIHFQKKDQRSGIHINQMIF
ncbi:unnamed protein product [Paramecium pentaurelia]|uniref:Uncharacterized protein n=1 Tax=Paramecium pentaurelia TaxID=43138 RepID=A0A8S1WUL5_9CILI|nr:unnamed protein product [Paramecium pentaurelia]